MPSRAWIAIIVATAPGFACGNSGRAPDDWVAQVDAVAGKVTVSRAARSAPAKVGGYLQVGATLRTGPSARAELKLRGGGRLTVKPGSVVSFREGDRRLALELERGSVIGRSAVEASDLIIEVGGRRIRLAGRSEATVATTTEGGPSVLVELGRATIEGPEGDRRIVVAGAPLTLVMSPRQDAGPPDAGPPDSTVVQAQELVLYVESVGRGRVLVRGPDDRRYRPLARGRRIEARVDTRIKLLRRARAVVGSEPGKGAVLSGPAEMLVVRPTGEAAAAGGLSLSPTRGEVVVSAEGKPGTPGASLMIEGVALRTRIRHRKLMVRVRPGPQRATVAVSAGEAALAGRKRGVVLEADQRATVRRGAISPPQLPPVAPVQVKRGGAQRLFVSARRLPLTLRWSLPEGVTEALVEVGRGPGMSRPLFADRLRRRQLTLPAVRLGSLFWRVRPVQPDGTVGEPAVRGRLSLLTDSSHRALEYRRVPHNVLRPTDRDTVVYYQNRLPKLTLGWQPPPETSGCRLKVFRDQDLAKPVISRQTSARSVALRSGQLAEGSYVWYVACRDAQGRVKSTRERRLSIRYDNATPDLQIRYPRNGITVAESSIEVQGVTFPGSQVFINGGAVELDKTFRFRHPVQLKPGANQIVLRVVDRRRRASMYLRQVTRR